MRIEELDVIKGLSERIRNEERRLQNLRDWIGRLTQELREVPNATKTQKSKIETLTIRIIDCENLIAELETIRDACAVELIKRIDETIEDATQKAILVERYAFATPFKVIARQLSISESQMYAQHKTALKILAKSFDIK